MKIPNHFWKVVVTRLEDGSLSATAYIINQNDLVDRALEKFVFGPFLTYQVPIATIEQRTGLKFGLNRYDPLSAKLNKRGALEAFSGFIELTGFEDLVL